MNDQPDADKVPVEPFIDSANKVRVTLISIERSSRPRRSHSSLLRRWLLLTLVALFSDHGPAAATPSPVRVTLGHAVVALNGPWRFHTGDSPRCAEPDFDDSTWETVDLTPAPGAHDSDVGLTGYVSGWQARGHRGYFGYAWYRIRVSLDVPQLPAVLLLSVGLFAQELSMLHVPGIWFPSGTGVSRTEYAYAAFDVALFLLLLRRLYAFRQPLAVT